MQSLNKKSSKLLIFFCTFGKSYLTHLKTNVMVSGWSFAILAMFLVKSLREKKFFGEKSFW